MSAAKLSLAPLSSSGADPASTENQHVEYGPHCSALRKKLAQLSSKNNPPIAFDGDQLSIKPKSDMAQKLAERNPAFSDFVLSADALAYIPQASSPNQTPTPKTELFAPQVTPGVLADAERLQEKICRRQVGEFAADSVGRASPIKRAAQASADLVGVPEAQSQFSETAGNRKVSEWYNVVEANPTVPLKFCKFLIGEDVAGFPVGRKGVGGSPLLEQRLPPRCFAKKVFYLLASAASIDLCSSKFVWLSMSGHLRH